MKTLPTLLTSMLLAAWMSLAAIIAIQNFSSVSLKFLTFQSIEIPVGVLLVFGVGIGSIGTAIAPLLLSSSQTNDDEI